MTKNKKLVSRMMFALLVLTLVSFCFVGFTFARYTTGRSASATTQVAKWAIADNWGTESSVTISFDKLSPSNAEKPAEGAAARTNSTAKRQVLVITNSSEVAADVTLTLGEMTLTTTLTDANDVANAKKPFSIAFYTSDANDAVAVTLTDGNKYTAPTLAPGETLTIWAQVTWTSDGLDGVGDADANDTMIGQNVTAVNWNISYTAVQASQIPNA